MILTIFAWAAGGGKWRLYLAAAFAGTALLFLAYRVWRASLINNTRNEIAARQTAKNLATLLDGVKTDETLRNLPLAARRERLRAWTTPAE